MKTRKNIRSRPPYLGNLLLAIILATIIFVGVFLFGYYVSYYKYKSVLQSQEELRYSLLSFEVEKELLEWNCENFDAFMFSSEIEEMGKIIDILEERFGKEDQRVLDQKKTYSLLEARHFLYIKEYNNLCEDKVNTILFFYSNKKENKQEAERMGRMLSSLKKEMPKVMIYSFDYDLSSSLISLLKNKYVVSRPGVLVINEKALLNVFKDVEEIKSKIN